VLEKVAQSNKIEASDADLENEIGRLAQQMRASAAEVARSLRQSGRETGVRDQIRERKALEWVVEKAKVTDHA